MIIDGVKLSITRIPLTTASAGFFIEEELGYFHVWRFENPDGSFTADGEIQVTFGAQQNVEPIPFGHNAKITFDKPVTRTQIAWKAQNRTVVLLTAASSKKMDTSAPAARIITNVGVSLNVNSVAVPAAPGQVLAYNATRQRGVIQAPLSNSLTVEIGGIALAAGAGIQLDPGDAFVIGANSAAIYAVAAATGCTLRYWEEY